VSTGEAVARRHDDDLLDDRAQPADEEFQRRSHDQRADPGDHHVRRQPRPPPDDQCDGDDGHYATQDQRAAERGDELQDRLHPVVYADDAIHVHGHVVIHRLQWLPLVAYEQQQQCEPDTGGDRRGQSGDADPGESVHGRGSHHLGRIGGRRLAGRRVLRRGSGAHHGHHCPPQCGEVKRDASHTL
jgi:hypothetical protein